MAEDALSAWEVLFRRALEIIDAVAPSGARFERWSFGGGTVLMRRFRHRVSKDVDIFVPDPQYLGYVSPRLNDRAEELARDFLETATSVKLYFPEGEIDFIAASPLIDKAAATESILGRKVRVDSTAEIIAKKVHHRASLFTARDIFDLAIVAKRDPESIEAIRPILRGRRVALARRLAAAAKPLRTAFGGLHTLGRAPSYDECLEILKRTLDQAQAPRSRP